MDKILAPYTPATCSPAFSIAGVMPAASQMTWKTAFPNPDALISAPRPAGHGPVFSVAGVIVSRTQVLSLFVVIAIGLASIAAAVAYPPFGSNRTRASGPSAVPICSGR